MNRDSNKSSTVLKAFRVLEAVADSAAHPSAAELSRQLEMDRVTVYRMLRTLEAAGYLTMNAENKRFALTNRTLALAKPFLGVTDETARIDALLTAVATRTGETCHFSELSGVETVLTRRVKGRQLVAVDFQIGNRCELHATSVGKAILAFQPSEFIQDYMRLDMVGYTPRTITDPDKLDTELATIRELGVGFDMEELSLGMNCVAVPVHALDDKVEAGISISGPAFRLTPERLEELGKVMAEEAKRTHL